MPSPAFDVDRLLSLGRVSAVAPSPDGTWVAASVARLDRDGNRFASDLWRVPLDGDGPPVRLTRTDSRDVAPAFRRDGTLAFLSDRNPRDAQAEDGDTERMQLWLLPAAGGEPYPLTDEPLGVMAFAFAERADRLVLIARVLLGVPHEEQRDTAARRAKHGPSALRYTRMPVRLWDDWIPDAAPHVIAYDERGGGRRDLTPSADREHRELNFDVEWALSPDGRTVAVTHAAPGADRLEDHAVALIDAHSGAARVIGRADGVMSWAPRFSPDGSSLACIRHQRSPSRCGREELWLYDVASGEGRALAPDYDAWPVPACWTADGAAVLAVAADRGCEPVVRVDVHSGEVTRVTATAAGGCHGSIHLTAGGTRIVGVRHTLRHPPEPFAAALSAEAEPTLLCNLSGFSPEEGAAIAKLESMSVTAADGAEVQSFLALPAGAGADLPCLMWIHGGPIGHNADAWHWRWNALIPVAAGYALALPNPRGSSGFGQDFIEGIWGNRWGAECYTDLMAVTDALEARPELDADRIGAMGGSFGGYMANWIGGQTDRFRCLVTHASIFSMSAFHGVTDFPAYFALETGCTPYDDPDAFDRYSPYRHVANWKTPTLILHGERDYRVPISEALALFEALQHHGVASELVVFPDENHWILKPNNVRQWYAAWQVFVRRHLG